jgi:hypothetical protein
MKPPHVARDLNAAARVLTALDLAIQGCDYRTIAERAGYASKGAAFNAVQRELQRTFQHKADDLRTLEAQRLDALLQSMMPKALAGDTWSVDRVLAIMERRARLFGLDIQASQAAAAAQTLIRTYDAETEAV